MRSNLKLIVPNNFIEFGKKVNGHINLIRETKENYIIRPNLVRFSNGEGKCVLEESIRGKDAYILTDVSNYGITYKNQVGDHHMMPDEHFMDIIRIISSTCSHAQSIKVIMPYLYQSRQDKREGRSSLDLSVALQILRSMNVDEMITADVHNKTACDNASPSMSIDNFYCSDDILLELLNKEQIDFNKLMVIAPDKGALARANFYSNILGGVPLGVFEKQRDYTVVKDGKNPITEHKFLSDAPLDGKHVIVVDDMIASGGSILDTALQLKQRGAEKIYLIDTFGLFTEGIVKFNEYYNKGIFDKVYVTNLNYIPNRVRKNEWINEVDCSMKVAKIICNLNDDEPIGNLLKSNQETVEKIKRLKKDA